MVRSSVLVASLLGLSLAPSAPSAPATVVDHADIAKLAAAVKQRTDRPWTGQTARVVDVGGYNVGVTVITRREPETESLVHEKLTEIYSMMEGSGTLLSGGELINPGPPSAEVLRLAGPGFGGTGIRNGRQRRLSPGDVAIIPAGVPHMFSALDGPITYMILRVDIGKVLKLQ